MPEIHSKALMQRFPEVYNEYFQSNEIVASAPLMTRVSAGQPALSDKETPHLFTMTHLRGYCGLHIVSKYGIDIQLEISNFNAQKDEFETVFPLHDANPLELARTIEDIVYDKYGFPETLGIRVSWMFEILMGMKTPTLTSAMTALATAILILVKEIDEKDLEKIQEMSLKDIKTNKVVQKITELTKLLGDSLYKGSKPNPEMTLQSGNNIFIMQNNEYTFTLQEKYPNIDIMPLDMMMINTNTVTNREHQQSSTINLSTSNEAIDEFSKEFFKNDIEIKAKTKIADLNKASQTMIYRENMNLIKSLIQAAKDPGTGQLGIIESYRRIGITNQYFEVTHNISTVQDAFNHEQVAIVANKVVALNNTEFTVYAQAGVLQSYGEKYLKKLREKRPNAFAFYRNWENLSAPEGVKIEQNLFAKTTGKKNHYAKVSVYSNGEVTERIATSNSTPQLTNGHAICLDARNGKIYINGEKLKSDGIKSQKFAIEVIKRAIISPNMTVDSSLLPHGSYRENINTLKSKITVPLEEIMHEAKQNIDLIVNNGLNNEYTVTLHGDGSFIIIDNMEELDNFS